MLHPAPLNYLPIYTDSMKVAIRPSNYINLLQQLCQSVRDYKMEYLNEHFI
ncbi:hypothetical protein HanHA300_Chr09g0314171 [Helianthus annuus]|nr:hypothetical protein HanHA300_Chr09g0314171 [Helianthus annuus]KAJ0628212.1 hypothetical protein HanHA89_Chr01g0034211 [Helianthus annuus]KAJ0707644.1 hypothetical protein HanLR1_Chr09g0320781 [Helianthus annuus]